MTTPAQTLRKYAEHEQADLWHDLEMAVRYARNGYWSIGVESAALRVVRNAALIGALGWEKTPWALTKYGIYEALLGAAGLDVPDLSGTFNFDYLVSAPVAPGKTIEKLRGISADLREHVANIRDGRY